MASIEEIFKYNKKAQKILIPKIRDILKKESNNGVKNLYLRIIGKD